MAFAPISNNRKVSVDTDIRKVPLFIFNRVVDLLTLNNNWEKLAEVIKKPNGNLLFTAENLQLFKSQPNKRPSELLLTHLATCGKFTLSDLLSNLIEAKLLSLAQELADKYVEGAPEIPKLTNDLDKIFIHDSSSTFENSTIPSNDNFKIMEVDYNFLSRITNNFNPLPYKNGGNKLGEGGFGIVYYAEIGNQKVAVKKLNGGVDSSFISELNVLSSYKHENLVSLFFYSNNGPHACLVYEYLENGSLQDRLQDPNPLPGDQRLMIALGVANGLNHLHNFKTTPLIHRDVKSANVLLDSKNFPKVGDFGLARFGSQNISGSLTSTVIGTSPYMAPEAFNGEVSVYLDIYSFGVIVYELITGLPPFDEHREERDLVSHLLENCDDIKEFLDERIANWVPKIYYPLYELGCKCTSHRKKDRPLMKDIVDTLKMLKKL